MRVMKTYKDVKKGEKVTVVFSVGVAHPIYNKEVEAVIDFVGGYDGRQIHAHTVEAVHHPENPEGILVYGKNGKFLVLIERGSLSLKVILDGNGVPVILETRTLVPRSVRAGVNPTIQHLV